MNRREFLARAAMTAAGGLTVGAPVRAQTPNEAVVPVSAYAPELGESHPWRIELTSETRSAGGVDVALDTQQATFQQTMTVLGRTLEGFSVQWEFEKPTGTSRFDRVFEGTLELYGLNALKIGTDRAGMPLQTYGVAAIRQRIQETVAALPQDAVQSAEMLQYMLRASSENPLFEVQALAMAAILIGRLQSDVDWQARPGAVFRRRQSDHVYAAAISGDVDIKVEALDPSAGEVSVSWVWDMPLENLPALLRERINERLDEIRAQAFALPGPLRDLAQSAAHRFTGKARISSKTGTVVFAEEVRSMRIGLETTLLTVRATRA